MQPRLDRDELAQRFRRQASDLVIQIASLLQGGALSAAAFSLIAIFQTQDDIAIRLMLWLISMMLGLVMFFRLCHRALFLMHARGRRVSVRRRRRRQRLEPALHEA